MSQYHVLGSGPDPFAPEQRTLTSEEILRALALDPNYDMDHGRLRGLLYRLKSKRGIAGPTTEEQLLEWSLTVEPKRPNESAYDNPARLRDWNRSRRPLTAGDFEFLRTFEGPQPAKVAASDVKLLAELEAEAESESERRVVARVLGPIRRHHDRKQEEAALLNVIDRHAASGYRSATVRNAWLPTLAERLTEERRAEVEPQLAGLAPDVREKVLRGVETDAHQEAETRLRELWATLDADGNAKVKAARRPLVGPGNGNRPGVECDPDPGRLEHGGGPPPWPSGPRSS